MRRCRSDACYFSALRFRRLLALASVAAFRSVVADSSSHGYFDHSPSLLQLSATTSDEQLAAGRGPQPDLDLAQKLAYIADAAYCGDRFAGGTESITDWTCPPCKVDPNSTDGGRLKNVSTFGEAARQTFGFVGVTDNWGIRPHIVVSFRGSVRWVNYFDSRSPNAIPWNASLLRHPGGRGSIHEGIYQAYEVTRGSMMEKFEALRASYPSYGILVTGHSFGGALAVYAADELATSFPETEVKLYAFANQRPGDEDFVKSLDGMPNLEAGSVVHRGDDIPVHPQLSLGFWQLKRVL